MLRFTSQADASRLSSLDLDEPSIWGTRVVALCGRRKKVKPISVSCENLTDAAYYVAIGCELAAGEELLELADDLVKGANEPRDLFGRLHPLLGLAGWSC